MLAGFSVLKTVFLANKNGHFEFSKKRWATWHTSQLYFCNTHQNVVNKTRFKLFDFNSGVKIIEPHETSDHRANLTIVENKLH